MGKRFGNPKASSSAPYPQESNPWVSNVSEHTSPHVMSESQTPVQDQRCQSRPSARNSVVLCEGGFSKYYVADQRLQISDPHFDKFSTTATFACWKVRFKTEVCTCSQFLTEAMHWIKEVEMVDSVDDLKSSCKRNSNALRKGQSRGTKNPKRGSFSPRKTDRLLDLPSTSGSLVPTILSRIIPTYSLLVFEVMIFRNSTQSGTEFYCL